MSELQDAQQERDIIVELKIIKRELEEELGGRLETIHNAIEPILKPIPTAEKPEPGVPPPAPRCAVMRELTEIRNIIASLCRASSLTIDRIDI